jgi:hypothetical protein
VRIQADRITRGGRLYADPPGQRIFRLTHEADPIPPSTAPQGPVGLQGSDDGGDLSDLGIALALGFAVGVWLL